MQSFVSMEEAFGLIGDAVQDRLTLIEQVSLSDAVNRYVAEPVVAQLSIPPHTNSARDGFALSAEQSLRASRGEVIPIAMEIRAGDSPDQLPADDSAGCVQIMTGAPVPPWATHIAMVEETEQLSACIRVARLSPEGMWIRHVGSDIRAGEAILAPGRRVLPEHIQALASSGVTRVSVHRLPKVAVCSTGEELVQLDAGTPGPGQIYDSNRPFMAAMLTNFGCDLVVNQHVGDSLDEMTGYIKDAMAAEADLVVSSGAVSMGNYYFVKPALEAIGAELIFHKVTQKPGKPLLFARLPNGALYFGLPGNPVSTVVNCRFYVHYALTGMQQRPPESPLKLRLAHDFEKQQGQALFLKAIVRRGKGGAMVEALDGQESFETAPLLKMNGWIVLSEHVGSMSAGDLVSFFPASPRGLPDIF